MRSAGLVAALMAVLVVPSAQSQEKAPVGKDQVAESAKKVRELRKERIDTLEKMVDQLTAQYKHARVPYGDVLDGQQLLIEAKLDAAETDQERVGFHERLVEVLKAREAHAEEQAKAGRELQSNVLKAKAKRLEAEIHFEQAKMKLAKPIK